LAEGGTLLLNEIGELTLPLQAKLLTFLDTKEFTRVGGEKKVEVSARLIAATNRDLEGAVKENKFRGDLFYRLNVVPIHVPPLRERREDLPVLVQEILHGLCREMQCAELPIITPSTMKAFRDYGWPGNIRELHNVLERALITSAGARVEIPFLGSQPAPGLPEGKVVNRGTTDPNSLIYPPDSLPSVARPHGDMRRRPLEPGREVLEILWQDYIIERKWSITQLAEAMNIGRPALSKWFTKHGISDHTT
jgi:DNA-binding NtrC family response regulator